MAREYSQTKRRCKQMLDAQIALEAQEWFDEANYDSGVDDDESCDSSIYVESQLPMESPPPRPALFHTIDIPDLLIEADHRQRRAEHVASKSPTNSSTTISDVIHPGSAGKVDGAVRKNNYDDATSRKDEDPVFPLVRSQSLSSLQTPDRKHAFPETYGDKQPPTVSSSCPYPALSFIRELVPEPAMVSLVGPALRTSLVVTTGDGDASKPALVILSWSHDVKVQTLNHTNTINDMRRRSHHNFMFRVVPITGCSNSVESAWVTADRIQHQIMAYIESQWSGWHTSFASHYQCHVDFSTFMVDHLEQWQRTLSENVNECSEYAQVKYLSKALEQIGIPHESSLDCYKLFLRYHQAQQSSLGCGIQPFETDLDQNCFGDVCLSCFDEISCDNSGATALWPCGHRMCLECWHRYLKSAANTGQGHVLCPAYKCPLKVGLYDAAHILFVFPISARNDADDIKKCNGDDVNARIENALLYAKLVGFELENFAKCSLKARHCRSPNCEQFLATQSSLTDDKFGWTLSLCCCGLINCTSKYCQAIEVVKSSSHPGLSCEAYQKLCNLDKKLNEEVQSLLKLIRTCPQCNYGIEKDGGCNHVHCLQCNYYFCWECGGSGKECSAFECLNPRRKANKKIYRQALMRQAELVLSCHKKIQKLEAQLQVISRKIAHTDNCVSNSINNANNYAKQIGKHCHMEFSLCQILLWLYFYKTSKLMDDETADLNNIDSAIFQLELLTHVLTVRNSSQPISQSQFALPCGTRDGKKYRSKRKMQLAEQRSHANNNANTFQIIWMNQAIRVLSNVGDVEFVRSAQKALQTGIRQLWELSSSSPSKSRQLCQQNWWSATEQAPLNSKMKRSGDPWKNGMRRDISDDESIGERTSRRWKKTRARVQCRRRHLLDDE